MGKLKKTLQKKINGALTTQAIYAGVSLGLFEDKEVLNSAPKQLVRALAALDLIAYEKGQWGVTEEGSYLTKEHPESLRTLILYKAAPYNWRAYGNLIERLRGAPPFDLFAHLNDYPEDMGSFQEAMASFEKGTSLALLEDLPLARYESACDLGCGAGGFLKRLKTLYPHLALTGMDLKAALPHADPSLDLRSGNFFEEVPAGFSLYILRNILHDWSDQGCLRILGNIPKEADILVVETLIPDEPERRLGAFSDLHLFATTSGGRERTLKEYETLFLKAERKILFQSSSTSAKSALLLGSKLRLGANSCYE